MSFQEYDYSDSRGGPLIFSLQMVHILGASSLSRVIEKSDYNSRRTLKKTITAIPGLLFNQNNKNDLKVIPTLLSKGRLSKNSKKENFIIWHDAVNNSLSRHPSNFNTRLTPKQLQRSLIDCRHCISAIVYCKRFGTPDVFQKLCETAILTLNVKKSILSKRKSKNLFIIKDLARVHPATKTDCTILSTVLAHAAEFEKLIKKERSKSCENKPSLKQRINQIGQNWR